MATTEQELRGYKDCYKLVSEHNAELIFRNFAYHKSNQCLTRGINRKHPQLAVMREQLADYEFLARQGKTFTKSDTDVCQVISEAVNEYVAKRTHPVS